MTLSTASAPHAMTKKQAVRFITALAHARPDAESELVYASPFELLVAVVLSAQATDKSVNKVTPSLFSAAPDPAAMAHLGEESIATHIRSIGLWRSKARNLNKLCHQLCTLHNGDVPSTRKELEALAGVGRKTANVVLNVIFGEDAMAVDTHIFRIGNRTGLAPGKTPRQVEDGLRRVIPPDMLRPAHHWLILHGRYTCKARYPLCGSCPAYAPCRFPLKARDAHLLRVDKNVVAPDPD
ncbi:Endonuclease III [Acetobacteraceae bacterium EV16G]|uniref:endonuclease III n=1 Tax=Sorlinia euscelidii TaxID=3081148 RepID=UPI002F373B9E